MATVIVAVHWKGDNMSTEYKTIISVTSQLSEPWQFESPTQFDRYPVVMGSTYREGGVSKEPCTSLNLAFHVGDNPDDVVKNRALLASYLHVNPARMTCGNQVHGLNAVQITEDFIGAGAFGESTAINDCDAIFTNIPNVPLLLFTADCVAVGIYDTAQQAVAVVHAGWKGAIGHLPVITIQAMTKAYGTKPEDCIVFLGPSIGPESFEVNQELADRFVKSYEVIVKPLNEDEHADNTKSTKSTEPTESTEFTESTESSMDVLLTRGSSAPIVRYIKRPGAEVETPHVNLWEFIRADLVQLGVPNDNITIGGTDSMVDEHCFSYRREAGKTGRMAMFGMIK